MPPKKNNIPSKPKPASLTPTSNKQDTNESTEAELKFDQEVLWCISQFENLLSTGKLPEAKSKYL